jgi:hypothetical protein
MSIFNGTAGWEENPEFALDVLVCAVSHTLAVGKHCVEKRSQVLPLGD